jgi:hypothetical protein
VAGAAARGAVRPVATEVLQWWWRAVGTWKVEHWRLPLGVWARGEPSASRSWRRSALRPPADRRDVVVAGAGARGQGIGVEMRAAVLGLAFDHLGAEVATSGAWETNAGSLGVSRSLGYETTAQLRHVHHDRVGVMRRVRLPRGAVGPTVHRSRCTASTLSRAGSARP